jgi:hypothetical protein
VLEALQRDGASGELELDGGTVRYGIHFRRGRVQAVESTSAVERLGDVLVEGGEVSRGMVERAATAGGATLLGHRLLASGLSARTRDRALEEQRRRRLALASRCVGAWLRFHPGRALPPGGAEAHALERWDDTGSGHVGAARRRLCALLGLSVESPAGVLRRAFRVRVRALHPDLAPGEDLRALHALLEGYRAWDRGGGV